MNKIKLFFKGLSFIFLYFILTIGLYFTCWNHIYSDNKFFSSTSNIFVTLLILFIFIIIFRDKIIPDFYNFKKNGKKYIKENFKYWIIGLIIMIFTNLIIGLIFNNMATNEELNRQTLFNSPISSIISMIITAPIIEELITRKTFKEVFSNQYVYIIVSGLIFGSLHLLSATTITEILYVIPYSALGCAFAKIYYNTDNLWTNIFFHSLHNLIAIIIIFIGA